jgi:hypothetical protein
MKTKNIFCSCLLALGIIFKLWLVAEMEITDDPNDPAEYVAQILFNWGLGYGPGTGYVGKLFYELGIPFRFGIEIAYLVSSLLVLKALLEWPTRSFLSLGLYLFVIFNPAPEELFSHLMSDQVWLVETMLGLSFLVFFAGDRSKFRWIYALLSSLCLGFSVITRSALIPLMTAFLLWAALSGVLRWLKGNGRGLDFSAIGACLLCLYTINFFYYSTCYHHLKYHGFFGISLYDSREYKDFYMCLQSVGDPTGEKYYPIDDHRLELIGQAGPQSRWFVEQLGKASFFRKASMDAYGKPGLALCWFHCATFTTMDQDGNFEIFFALFKAVEDEIHQAAQEKRLKVRPIIPLPDCRIPIVLSAVPEASRHIAALTTLEPSRYAWDWGFAEPRFDNKYFSQALTRRIVTPSPLRENIGKALCSVYSRAYAGLLWALAVAMGLFTGLFVYRLRKIPAFSFYFLAQQLFAAVFVAVFLWYLLFDASGLLATSRYLVFNNVMLPILLVYYLNKSLQLLKGDYTGF